MHILWGLLGIGFSFLLIRYRRHIIDWTGSWAWAERYLGSGGSYSAVVLVAIFFFFFSITVMTGSLESFLGDTSQKLFSGGTE